MSLTSNHINYVEFPARDLAATQRFFSEVFGWRFQEWGEDYHSFSESGLEGGFYRADLASHYQDGSALVVIYSPELETMRDRIEAGGGTIVKPIFSFPGGRRFHFREPSGNELALWSDR